MSELTDLIHLYRTNPQEVERILRDNPSIRAKLIELDEIARAGEQVSVDGFRKAYEQFYGRPMPKVDEPVAEAFVWAFHNKKGVVFEAWRGFGKSTFFAAWGPPRERGPRRRSNISCWGRSPPPVS